MSLLNSKVKAVINMGLSGLDRLLQREAALLPEDRDFDFDYSNDSLKLEIGLELERDDQGILTGKTEIWFYLRQLRQYGKRAIICYCLSLDQFTGKQFQSLCTRLLLIDIGIAWKRAQAAVECKRSTAQLVNVAAQSGIVIC